MRVAADPCRGLTPSVDIFVTFLPAWVPNMKLECDMATFSVKPNPDYSAGSPAILCVF